MAKVKVYKLKDTIIINQDEENEFFYANPRTITISVFNLISILKVMLYNKLLSPKVLEGLVNEYRDNSGQIS